MKKKKRPTRSREISTSNGEAPEVDTEEAGDPGEGSTTQARLKLSEEERTVLARKLIERKEKLEESLAALDERRAGIKLQISEVAKEVYEKLGTMEITRNGVSFAASKHRGRLATDAPELSAYHFRNVSANALSLD